jgi:hypothetical protein
VTLEGGLRVKVNSATIDATSEVEAEARSQLGTEGEVSGLYPPDFCEPPQPDADSGGQLVKGQTVTGNLCYEIESDDASTLRLMGVASGPSSPQYLVWFALR